MDTLKTNMPAHWAAGSEKSNAHTTLLDKFNAFADAQKEKKAFWFFAALTVQGIFFLPLPVFLVYYFNASITIVLITMVCFFTSIIAYMGGAGIRSVVLLSIASILIQVLTAIAVMVL
ncbi:MAG: hypothetical protein JST19_02210 [Bacteroidetes bacterium]|nr:hypothetical protein [Bacteroidota bacterium]